MWFPLLYVFDIVPVVHLQMACCLLQLPFNSLSTHFISVLEWFIEAVCFDLYIYCSGISVVSWIQSYEKCLKFYLCSRDPFDFPLISEIQCAFGNERNDKFSLIEGIFYFFEMGKISPKTVVEITLNHFSKSLKLHWNTSPRKQHLEISMSVAPFAKW